MKLDATLTIPGPVVIGQTPLPEGVCIVPAEGGRADRGDLYVDGLKVGVVRGFPKNTDTHYYGDGDPVVTSCEVECVLDFPQTEPVPVAAPSALSVAPPEPIWGTLRGERMHFDCATEAEQRLTWGQLFANSSSDGACVRCNGPLNEKPTAQAAIASRERYGAAG